MWRWHSRGFQSRTLSKDTCPSRMVHPTCSGYGNSVAAYVTAYRSALGTARIREHLLEGHLPLLHDSSHLPDPREVRALRRNLSVNPRSRAWSKCAACFCLCIFLLREPLQGGHVTKHRKSPLHVVGQLYILICVYAIQQCIAIHINMLFLCAPSLSSLFLSCARTHTHTHMPSSSLLWDLAR